MNTTREESQRSIMQMCRGAFQERVDYEMPRLIENILDPNTSAKAKRKVTITLELCPDDTEADGGMWKLDARRTIKAYLEAALKDDIDAGRVVVMM